MPEDLQPYIMVGNTLAQLSETVPASIKLNKYGVAAATLNYTVQYAAAVPLVLLIQQHPVYTFLLRESAEIERDVAGIGNVTINFKGVPPAENPNYPDNKVYSVRGATSTAPIETHPDFADFAGTPDTPLHGAKFSTKTETLGKFLGFTDSMDRKYGVRSFYIPSLVYEETQTKPSSGDTTVVMSSLGKIDVPPSSSIKPTLEAERNWMLSTAEVEQVGAGVQQRKGWRASGPGGWDPDIHG